MIEKMDKIEIEMKRNEKDNFQMRLFFRSGSSSVGNYIDEFSLVSHLCELLKNQRNRKPKPEG